ncbi:MAG: hypothetical protein OXC91_15150, partial [Rhodobacteraceae bacterium]|nr:hypothetical protein [Paracoccaceae bacterium]
MIKSSATGSGWLRLEDYRGRPVHALNPAHSSPSAIRNGHDTRQILESASVIVCVHKRAELTRRVTALLHEIALPFTIRSD